MDFESRIPSLTPVPVLGVGGKLDPLNPESQAELSRNLQIATTAIDASGLCLFVAFAVLDDSHTMQGICELLSGYPGREMDADEFLSLGRKTLARERAFNATAGFSAVDDRLPGSFQTETRPPHTITFQVSDQQLDSVLANLD